MVRDQGKVTGYLSIRSVPTEAQIQQAEAVAGLTLLLTGWFGPPPPLHGLLGPALLAAGLATLALSRQVGTRLWKILSGLERLDLDLSHDVEQFRG